MSGDLTPEAEADAAFAEYSRAIDLALEVNAHPHAASHERLLAAESVIRARQRFECLFLALDAPTPPDVINERNELACEGGLLIAALGGFIGLLAPTLSGESLGLIVIGALACELTRWSYRFATKLIPHIRRRM